ncbi:MAG: hypothetical protein ABIL25_06110 [candidate division WOR-3 bacterium]
MSIYLTAMLVLGQFWQTGPQTGFRFTRFDGEYSSQTGKVYFLGGRLADDDTDGSVWCFIPDSGTYRDTRVEMPIPVSNYTICGLRDGYAPSDSFGFYIVGGRRSRGQKTDAVQAYYPVTNNARSVSTDLLPMRIGNRIPIPGAAAVCGNKLYVFGGFNESLAPYLTGETWVFDPMGPVGACWSRVVGADLSLPRCYITSAVVNGKIYALGGCTFVPNVLTPRRICEVFDPANPSAGWRRIADLPDSSAETRAFGFDSTGPAGFANRIVLAGNGKWPSETNQCFIYDTKTDSWATFPSLLQARKHHAAALIPAPGQGGRIWQMWVFGGRQGADTAVLKSAEFYNLPPGVAEQGDTKIRTHTLALKSGPFTRRLSVRYSVPSASEVMLVLLGPDGRVVQELVRGYKSAGVYEIGCDAAKLSAGVYLVHFSDGQHSETAKAVKAR